jgi:small-conductance mechanosensitive channel
VSFTLVNQSWWNAKVNILRVALVSAVALVLAPTAFAQDTLGSQGAADQQVTSRQNDAEPAPLIFWNRQITIFRAYSDHLSPQERAIRAAARLAALPESGSGWQITTTEVSSGQTSGVLLAVNGYIAFAILDGDLDREAQETLKTASDYATSQLRAALDARTQQRRGSVLLRGIGLSLAATALLVLGLWLAIRAGRRILAGIDRDAATKPQALQVLDFDVRPLILSMNRGLVKLTTAALILVMLYVWLTFVLLRFPYSEPWGRQLTGFLIDLAQRFANGFVRSIPGMFTVAVIFILTRIATRVVNRFFSEVERGTLASSWLHSDTARATRRLVVVLMWIFALVVAYPYIPGSSTEAFKGISVFVGLMVSLGSAGFVNQVMSGLVVIYSRALRRGEFVRIGDDIGIVTDVGMLSTKLLTRKKEEITIPNAVLVGTRTVNYSRQANNEGAMVGTTVTIGYDAPWRQVHEMLLYAADQTSGVRKEPAPRVWQTALSDFYVEYELVVNLDHPEERVPVLSELHMHIQDAFNEQGVQIMSPHFETQPNEKVFVPKSQWFQTDSSKAKE